MKSEGLRASSPGLPIGEETGPAAGQGDEHRHHDGVLRV